MNNWQDFDLNIPEGRILLNTEIMLRLGYTMTATGNNVHGMPEYQLTAPTGETFDYCYYEVSPEEPTDPQKWLRYVAMNSAYNRHSVNRLRRSDPVVPDWANCVDDALTLPLPRYHLFSFYGAVSGVDDQPAASVINVNDIVKKPVDIETYISAETVALAICKAWLTWQDDQNGGAE